MINILPRKGVKLILLLCSLCVFTPVLAQEDAPSSEIAFTSGRDGNAEIYVMDADGQNVERLLPDDLWIDPTYAVLGSSFRWSPDGQSIAVSAVRIVDGVEWEQPRVYVIDVATGDYRLLSINLAYAPFWSFDGHMIGFISSKDIDVRWSFGIVSVAVEYEARIAMLPNDIRIFEEYPSSKYQLYVNEEPSETEGDSTYVVDIQAINNSPESNSQIIFQVSNSRMVAYVRHLETGEQYPGETLVQNGWEVFSSDMDGDEEIYVRLSPEGTPIQYTDNEDYDVYPDWRPEPNAEDA